MNVRVFQSDHGDCLLLQGSQGTKILVDGGLDDSFREHVAPALGRLGPQETIDLICVSHVDRDHVYGILALMELMVDWRVYHHRRQTGEPAHRPALRETPAIGEIWHNAFHESANANRGRLERFLGQSSRILSGHQDEEVRLIAQDLATLGQSVGDGIELSRRIGPNHLNIPLNALWGGKLITRTAPDEVIDIGELTIQVLGPTKQDLRKFRTFWNDWLKKNEAQLERIRNRTDRDEERLDEATGGLVLDAAEALAERLAQALGSRSRVTEPNLASIMLFVEDTDGDTALLTGDGHWEDIEAGLEACNRLPANGHLHLDLMKIAHHGSEHNSTRAHYRRISANHYVFCGNGHSKNPDQRIVDAVIDSRLNPAGNGPAAEAPNRRFTLWFNTDPDDRRNRTSPHMRQIRTQVNRRAQTRALRNRLRVRFFDGSSETIRV